MGEPGKTSARMSSRRINGAVIVLLGALWIALPFWFFAGPGMTKVIPTDFIFSPWPFIGLLVISFGLGVLGIARAFWLSAAIFAVFVVWAVALLTYFVLR
jgi:hypothetical protein